MMSYSGYDGFSPSTETTSIWTFDELKLQVHTFHRTTGRQETAMIHFNTTTRDTRGRGIVELASELPFDAHAELAESIVNVLHKTSKQTK